MARTIDRRWLNYQTRRFRDARPTYVALASTVEKVLGRLRERYAPMAMVGARAKTVQSFAEKAIRKQEKYRHPWRQLTDLAGGRLVAYTREEAEAACRWIEREEGLTIDWANSLHTRERLRTAEFGYLASHYVVQLTGPRILGIGIDPGLQKLKCEVQVSTFLQHVWAAIGHDRIYKGNLRIPESIERKTAEVAALLELADTSFAETTASLDEYLANFATSLPTDRLAEEIERWQAVLAADPAGPACDEIRCRLGRLHLAAGRPRSAHTTMKPLQDSQRPDMLRELGRAAHLAGRVADARDHLEMAIELDDQDWLAHAYFGDLQRGAAPEAALESYGRAHRLAPEEPRVLVPLLECELRVNRNARMLRQMCGSLQAGIDECRRRIDLRVHLPHAHLEEGRLSLYLAPDRPYAALAAYSRAVADIRDNAVLTAELATVERIVTALSSGLDGIFLEECEPLQGFVWVRDFLRLAVAARLGDMKLLDDIVTGDDASRPAFERPVLIVAGGCSPESEPDVESCQQVLRKALDGFTGTVIGGGTRAGISGLTARLLGRQANVQLLGYLPHEPSRPEEDRIHPAYTNIETRGCGYTPLGPLQTWADLLRTGVEPADVRVLGVNGGDLAGFEYRLALALGAAVGVVEGSGRAAGRLLPDPFWQGRKGFAPLPRDWASIAAFVNSARPAAAPLDRQRLDDLARLAHENYRAPKLSEPGMLPDNLLPWEVLPESLKGSNRDQVRHAVHILWRAGFAVRPRKPKTSGSPSVPRLFQERLDEMAEMEHGRYNAERLSAGWRLGETNDAGKRTNPTLISWADLPDAIKDYDRDAVRAWPGLLWQAGFRIVRSR